MHFNIGFDNYYKFISGWSPLFVLPQLQLNFLSAIVAENDFVKGSKRLHQMVIGAIARQIDLSENSNESSRAIQNNEVYVFSFKEIGEYIMKYEFLTLI